MPDTPPDGAPHGASPLAAGLTGRCPRCGRGPLYQGVLKVAPSCTACGLDYSFADAGDGPAVFVILIAGALVVLGVLWLEFNHAPPLWVHALVWTPVTLVLSVGLLRVLKGVLIGLQYGNDAREGRLDR